MRKDLNASKKRLAEKTTAADKLQKSLSEARSENSQLELEMKELEAQLEKTTDTQGDQAPDEQEAASTSCQLAKAFLMRGSHVH